MPFAKNRGCISGVAEHLGYRDFPRRERDVRTLDRHEGESGADRIATCHERCARRRAARLHQELRQAEALNREAVDARRWGAAQLSATISADIAIADVVGEYENDVWLLQLR